MAFDAFAEAEKLREIVRKGPGLRDLAERLERIPVAVLVVDDAAHYIAANDRACTLTGYTREELLARSIPDVTVPADMEVQERLWRALHRTVHQSGRYTILRKDRTAVTVEYDAFWDIGAGMHVSFLKNVREKG